MSYSLEQLNAIADDDDPTIVFFRDELKLSLYYYDQERFIEDLITNYKAYTEKMKGLTSNEPIAKNSPKAFISYKSEDYEKAIVIWQKLRKSGVDAWLDRERLKGEWKPELENQINTTDAFILLQSENLYHSAENYVNKEIRLAIERSKGFKSSAEFIYPAFIDSRRYILRQPSELYSINSYDLSDSPSFVNIGELAKDITRTHERNRY